MILVTGLSNSVRQELGVLMCGRFSLQCTLVGLAAAILTVIGLSSTGFGDGVGVETVVSVAGADDSKWG